MSTSLNSSIMSLSALVFLTWMIISCVWVILFVVLHLLLLVLLIQLLSSLLFINACMLILELICHLFLLLSTIVISAVGWFFVMVWLLSCGHHISIRWNILWMPHTMSLHRLSIGKLILDPVVVYLRCLWILSSINLTLIVSILISISKVIVVCIQWWTSKALVLLMMRVGSVVQKILHISCISQWTSMVLHVLHTLSPKLLQVDQMHLIWLLLTLMPMTLLQMMLDLNTLIE